MNNKPVQIESFFGPSHRKVQVGDVITLCQNSEVVLQCGEKISNFPVAFKTFGNLNEKKTNAILICHALTADQYIIGTHPVTGKPGWWEEFVGPGKPIDTNRFFIIVPNVLGGCMGTLGPKETNPKTGKPYNLDFPFITLFDMVKVQRELVEVFGIKKLASVIGGSMGGMQVLEWMSKFPEYVGSALMLATPSRLSAQNIAFNEVGRQAIMNDPDWCNGNYIQEGKFPVKGLSLARMMAHITYLSESGLQEKFGRKLQDKDNSSFGFDAGFQVESYLRHQGISFVERFDPNTYLYITRAMDYFDLEADHGGNLALAFEKVNFPVCMISFNSDWRFKTEYSKQIVHALSASNADVSFVELDSDKGHDAFLIESEALIKTVTGFMKKII